MIKELITEYISPILSFISPILSLMFACVSAYNVYLNRMVFIQKEKMNLYNTLNDLYEMVYSKYDNLNWETEHNGIKYKDINANLQMSKLCCSKETADDVNKVIIKSNKLIQGIIQFKLPKIPSKTKKYKIIAEHIFFPETEKEIEEEAKELLEKIKKIKEKLEEESFQLTERGILATIYFKITQWLLKNNLTKR